MEPLNEAVSKRKIIFGILLLFIGGTVISLLIPKVLISYSLSLKIKFIVSRILYCIMVLLMIWYAFKKEKQDFLIWHDVKRSFNFYVIAIIVIIVLISLSSILIAFTLKQLHFNNDSKNGLKFFQLLKESHWLIYVSAITAGVTEELLFRGYLMPRLKILLKSSTSAIILSSLFFALLHYGWGTVNQIIGPFYIGCVFAVFYQKYRNIKVLIICHTLYDLIALLGIVYFHH